MTPSASEPYHGGTHEPINLNNPPIDGTAVTGPADDPRWWRLLATEFVRDFPCTVEWLRAAEANRGDMLFISAQDAKWLADRFELVRALAADEAKVVVDWGEIAFDPETIDVEVADG